MSKLKLNFDAKPYTPKKLENLFYEQHNKYTHQLNPNNGGVYNNNSSFNINNNCNPPMVFQSPNPMQPQNFNNQMYTNNYPYYPSNSNKQTIYRNNDYNNNYHNRNFLPNQPYQKNIRENNKDNDEDKIKPKYEKKTTPLNANSSKFIPRSKLKEIKKTEKIEEKKEDNNNNITLNINAPSYKPRNTQLRQKEDLAHPKMEENKFKDKENAEKDKKTPGDDGIIEKKYFIAFKNKDIEKKEKFTFEYIMQFKSWKISNEDDLLTNEVKEHFKSFNEEIKDVAKKKKGDDNKKKEILTRAKMKETAIKNLASMEKWARKDMTKEIKEAERYKKELLEENKRDVIKKDLRNLLNLLTPDNYNEIKEKICDKIKDSVEKQDEFLDVLFQKAVLENAYVKLYSKLAKDLDKELPQKSKRKEGEGGKKKKEHSEMRSHLIDKCRTIFQIEKNEKFDEYIKEKDPEERRSKLKKFIVGNINFITELMKIKILSKKVGPDCLKNLYDRYQKGDIDKTLKESTIEAIIKFADKFGRIIYEEEKNMNGKDKEEFKLQIDDIFKKLEKIKEEPGLAGYIKYSIINLEEKRKRNFALSEFEQSQIAKTKKELLEKELEKKGQITQDNINEKIKKEIKMYKDDLEFGEGIQNDEVWKETSKILNTKTFGKALGDVLEGYFVCASEIIDEGKDQEYIKKYINELIDFYSDSLESKKDQKDFKQRIIEIFDLIIDISLDIPNIFDIYAYVLKIILKNYMIEFTDLNELNKGEETLKHINEVMKHLRNYYQEDEKEEDFLEKLKELSYVKNNEDLFAWAFE